MIRVGPWGECSPPKQGPAGPTRSNAPSRAIEVVHVMRPQPIVHRTDEFVTPFLKQSSAVPRIVIRFHAIEFILLGTGQLSGDQRHHAAAQLSSGRSGAIHSPWCDLQAPDARVLAFLRRKSHGSVKARG